MVIFSVSQGLNRVLEVFDRLFKRFFNPKRLGYLYQSIRPIIIADMASNLKESLIILLEDEELAQGFADYGDALVKGRLQVIYGSLGGKQKGLNFALQGQNALDQFVDEEGRPKIAQILISLIMGRFRGKRDYSTAPYGERRDISRI